MPKVLTELLRPQRCHFPQLPKPLTAVAANPVPNRATGIMSHTECGTQILVNQYSWVSALAFHTAQTPEVPNTMPKGVHWGNPRECPHALSLESSPLLTRFWSVFYVNISPFSCRLIWRSTGGTSISITQLIDSRHSTRWMNEWVLILPLHHKLFKNVHVSSLFTSISYFLVCKIS